MKNKTKVVVGLAAMLAGTIGVAGVSTFAWFQTQNNAKITFTDAVVRGDTTSIAVSYDKGKQPSKNGLVTEAGADATGITSDNTKSSLVSISGAKTEVIDLSGNGREFYHPNNYKKVGEAESADSVKANITNGNSTFYLAFNVIVTNKGNQPTDVFLTSGSVVSVAGEAKSSSTEAQKAARVAIWQQGATVTGAVPGSDATLRTL